MSWQSKDNKECLAGDGHHVAFGRASAPQHHLIFAGEHPVGAHRCHRCFIQNADGSILPYSVRYFIRVYPECELTGQKLVELLKAESNLASCFADDRVHFMVDTDAAVARPFERFLREPVMFVMLCKGTRKISQMVRDHWS